MGVVERSREVMAVMALHEALRNVCINSDWTYSVFWTIRPRPRLRGGLGCKTGDEGSLMLMWEDGYCRPVTGAAASSEGATTDVQQQQQLLHHSHHSIHRIHSSSSLGDDVEEDDPVRRSFRKMSIQLYNYGEGLMGKVASDKCHKWVFRETSETEAGPLNYWQSSFDSHPPEWTDQFSAGIQTIAVIQAGHGLLQLGSCKIVAEDLHFVLRMRYTFESLENHAGGFMSQTFAPMRSRFFCGTSPTAAAATAAAASGTTPPPSSAWTTGSAQGSPGFFQQQSSDFRLRLGVSTDQASSQDFLRAGPDDNSNITSLRLSLQNAASAGGGDRSLGFDFRTDADVGGDGSSNGHGCFSSGIKRPGPATDERPNLLSRRMQFNKMNHHHLDDNSTTTLQQLLESNHHSGIAFSAPPAVFLANNEAANDLDHQHHQHHHHPSLMLQIPPVISSNNTSPMISPGNKMQRTGSMSTLQEAIERSQQQQQQQTRSGNTSPLAIRLSKFTEQFNNGGSSSHPGTPKPLSSSETTLPLHSQFSGSHPSTPSNSYMPASHPGTPKMTPPRTTAEMIHFAANGSGSHPTTPNKHVHHQHPSDSFLNDGSNTNGCIPASVSHSLMLDASTSNYADGGGAGAGGDSNKLNRSDHHLLMPAAPWENLKDALEMPSNSTDFMMDGFFE